MLDLYNCQLFANASAISGENTSVLCLRRKGREKSRRWEILKQVFEGGEGKVMSGEAGVVVITDKNQLELPALCVQL